MMELLALVWIAGCGASERSIAISGVPEDVEVTLRAGEAVIAHHRVRDHVTARSTARSHTLTARGPCGEVEIPLAPIETYGDTRLEYEAGPIARRRILVDTRDASPSTRVSIGTLPLEVPVGVTRAIQVLAPTCAEGREVRVGGERVGSLPERDDTDVLIDVRASHCYRIDRADRESLVLLTLEGTAADQRLGHLTAAAFHTLEAPIDFPFAPVPSRVDLDAIAPREDRDGHYAITSLVATPCE
jgi:hypothetical protein